MATDTYALAPLPQQTVAAWHDFVATSDPGVLRPLLAENVVFRSPAVQSPIPGREATLLVLTTVTTIFENFRYHRTFVAGSHDVGLEFSANIGKWQLKGIDLIKFNESGEMVEFEVMIRPLKALQVLAEEMGNRIGPQLLRMKEMAASR
ncbi:MAG: nuclear transport factor 2 family protein [Rhodopseudomonas sp.]|uniref:nuclear transport factor 2 family protein n=1 Tax=Rhodopseudomonas sp. TaxID=1078 RepID=UPI00184E5953|nr:nuclear transport factor 2 family protein [Rhodopseudomonas sp.]NVN87217.1 nuclear transport factor 2 family protein [Rhodopseudomonas sp.]